MDLELDSIEILWADFKLKHEYFLFPITGVKRPIEQFFRNLQVSINRIMFNPHYSIVILGDFNINVSQNANNDLYAKLYNCR